jgi:hypothetical protein
VRENLICILAGTEGYPSTDREKNVATRRKATTKSASTKKPTASDKKHKHRVGAKKPAGVSVGDLLAGLNKTSAKKGKKKSDKPVITLSGKAEELLKVQQVKATIKTLEGEQKSLEAELFPSIEEQRLALCLARKEYIGSVNVMADGQDENGNDVNAGTALYYRQNKFSPFNFFEVSSDDELQEDYEGKATVKHEALNAIVEALGEEGEEISEEDAEKILDDRMAVTHSLSLDEGILACNPDGTPVYPEIIAVLQEHLAEHLVSVTKVKPTEGFYKRSNFDPREQVIMKALQGIGLCRQNKAAIKAGGAPRQ